MKLFYVCFSVETWQVWGARGDGRWVEVVGTTMQLVTACSSQHNHWLTVSLVHIVSHPLVLRHFADTVGFCHVMLCILCRPALCLSVTFTNSVETNNHIFKKIFLSGSHTILDFPCRTLWQYSDGDPLTGAKITIFNQYLALASITAGPLYAVK